MGIKLPLAERKSRERLRDEYVESKLAETERLRAILEEFCRNHRDAYAGSLAQRWMGELRHFLGSRGRNQTAKEFYEALWLGEGVDWRQGREVEGQIRSRVEWVLRLTDHPRFTFDESRPDGHEGFSRGYGEFCRWEEDRERPAFPVAAREDAPALVAADADKAVERIVADFVAKVTDKLVDILVARPGYSCVLERGEFVAGTFVGDIRFTFPGGVAFRAHVKLITNYSVYGRPYGQYPLTFHDVMSGEGRAPVKFASEGQVHSLLGVKAWQPPVEGDRRRFGEVKTGDIVEAAEHGVALVTATRKGKATVHRPEAAPAVLGADVIRRVVARTTPTWNSIRSSASTATSATRHCLKLDFCDGSTIKVPLDEEENRKVEPLGYLDQQREVRRLGFASLLRQWEVLVPTGLHDVGWGEATGEGRPSGDAASQDEAAACQTILDEICDVLDGMGCYGATCFGIGLRADVARYLTWRLGRPLRQVAGSLSRLITRGLLTGEHESFDTGERTREHVSLSIAGWRNYSRFDAGRMDRRLRRVGGSIERWDDLGLDDECVFADHPNEVLAEAADRARRGG